MNVSKDSRPVFNCWCRRCVEEATHLIESETGDWMQAMQYGQRYCLCPECGNKRCPKATQHDNSCGHSNESGQPGSDYVIHTPEERARMLEDFRASLRPGHAS